MSQKCSKLRKEPFSLIIFINYIIKWFEVAVEHLLLKKDLPPMWILGSWNMGESAASDFLIQLCNIRYDLNTSEKKVFIVFQKKVIISIPNFFNFINFKFGIKCCISIFEKKNEVPCPNEFQETMKDIKMIIFSPPSSYLSAYEYALTICC